MTKLIIDEKDISKIKTKLIERKKIIISTFKEETLYEIEDIELLWKDLLYFIDNFLILTSKTKKKWFETSRFYHTWEQHSEYKRIPWGKVLICSPGNAPVPLILIILLSFVAVGNEVILCPSRKTKKTARLLYDILDSEIGDKCIMSFYGNGGRSALQEFVESGKVDLLYFQGGSKFRDSVYNIAYSNGVEVIFEGEGNVVAIIGDDINKKEIKEVTEKLLKSKTFCAGQMCTSPNTIFVHKDISEDVKNIYNNISKSFGFIPLMNDKQIDWLKRFINEEIKNNNINKIYPENYSNNLGIKPALIEISNLMETETDYLNTELFSPLAFYIKYEDIDNVIKLLKNKWKYGLQVSLFSHNQKLLTKIEKATILARLTINITPIYQNSLLPWGGYKLSGFSFVEDFLEKATKPIIIEGNIMGDER